MAIAVTIRCPCGLLVVSPDELDVDGLCCDCASSGAGVICVCTSCSEGRTRLLETATDGR